MHTGVHPCTHVSRECTHCHTACTHTHSDCMCACNAYHLHVYIMCIASYIFACVHIQALLFTVSWLPVSWVSSILERGSLLWRGEVCPGGTLLLAASGGESLSAGKCALPAVLRSETCLHLLEILFPFFFRCSPLPAIRSHPLSQSLSGLLLAPPAWVLRCASPSSC